MNTKHIIKRQFFGRFNCVNLILLSLAVFAILFWIVSLKQNRIDKTSSRLHHLFDIQVSRIDNRLQRISDTVEALRNHAEMRFAGISEKNTDKSFALTENVFYQNKDEQFYKDINMANRLNTLFAVSLRTLRIMPQVYYTTSERFVGIYPKIFSREMRPPENPLQQNLYHMGVPEKNPGRAVFWTGIQQENDRMIACAAPVYDNRIFKGTVAVAVPADILGKQVSVFEPEKGNLFILNEQNQLIACPHFSDCRNEELCNIVKDSIRNAGSGAGPAVRRIKGYTLILKRLKCAPWTAVFLMPQPSGFASFTNRITLGILILLPCGLLMSLLGFRYAKSFFMHPAEILLTIRSVIHESLADRFRKISEERALRNMFRK